MSVTTDKNIVAQIVSSIREKINVDGDPLRSKALEALERLGLPHPKHEEYKYTPITRYLEKNFTFTPSPASGPLSDVKNFFIPGIESDRIVFIDGVYSAEHSQVAPSGQLHVQRLEEALASNHPVALQHFARQIDFEQDALAAWNTAAWQHGLFIHVRKNVVAEKPLIIYHIANGTSGEVVSVNRNLIVVDNSSEMTIIEKYHSVGKANHFANQVTEVMINENAGLNLFSIQNDPGNHFQFNHTQVCQKNTSRLNTFTFTLEGKLIRNNLQLALDGEGIESHMYGLYLLNGETLADNHTVVDHRKPNSFSNELYKGVMDGSSRGVFNGKIFVRPQAQKTNAFQANRNILLTDKATINTKPQLEIWADDVKCSHGCTSGQLDEGALFYLRSRGIAKDTARAMMLYAFAGEVLDHVQHPALNEYLDGLISERLHKNF